MQSSQIRLAIFLILSLPSWAQTPAATINGRVLDQAGAVIQGATIDSINVDTNLSRSAATNDQGLFSIGNLPPGNYRLEISKPGFRMIIKPGVVLHVQDLIVLNFEMSVGSASESVTVSADIPLINTTDGAVSTVVDRKFVENVPLNGRSFQTLIALTPGVVLTQAQGTEPGQFSVNGQRADANYFTIDGASANFGSSGGGGLGQYAGGALPGFSAVGGTNSLVSVDAMQEFRVQTSSFAPEYGRTPGGQISVVTRSGTNQWHGLLFDYFRNDVLDANNWFANNKGLSKPKERQNDFGGTFSGPILKDRTFFFFSYEGLRLRQPQTLLTLVPSQTARQSAAPSISPFLNAFPVPNGTDFGNGLSQFNSSFSNAATLDAYNLRLDHAINSKTNFFARYNYSPSQLTQRGLGGGLNKLTFVPVDLHTMTVGLTESVTQNVGNEFRANYSNAASGTIAKLDNFGGAVPPATFPFPAGFSMANSLFAISFGAAVGSPVLGVGKTATGEQRQINTVDNLLFSAGSHLIKLGVDYRWLAPFNSPLAYSQQTFFPTMTAAIAPLPVASSAFVQTQIGSALAVKEFSLYGQDSWKMGSRLTVTYGLRWDVNPPLTGKNANSVPFTVQGLNDPSTMSLAPRGTPLYHTVYGNVAPRLGLAAQVRQVNGWETSLRGGFGIFYDLGTGALGNVTGGFPFAASSAPLNVAFPLTPQQAAPPVVSLTPPVNTLLVSDPHLQLPRTYQWNVSLEQALGSRQAFTLGYIGSSSRDLLRLYTLSSPNPSFGIVSVTTNAARANYQSLQTQFQRRISHGLQALASYTWSHSIDNASRDSVFFNSPAITGSADVDRGNSDFDIRHTLAGALTYDFPSPAHGKFLRAVLSDWSADSFLLARSSPPANIVATTRIVGGTQFTVRPDVVAGQPLYLFGPQFPGGKAFNRGAFVVPPIGRQGTLSRNLLRTFGAWQDNFALRRQFNLTERVRLQFRGEFFNIFNHPCFSIDGLGLSLSQPLFGQAQQTLDANLGSGGTRGGLSPLYQIGGARSTQLALRLQF
jgi:hypothetical protein